MSHDRSALPCVRASVGGGAAECRDHQGHALTEAEVLEIRDSAACIALPVEVALSMENERGYRDLVAEDCWAQWQQYRRENQA